MCHPPLGLSVPSLLNTLVYTLIVTLAWNNHIDYICSKISKNVNIMTRLKRYLTSKSLASVYYSLIYPYLYYGCPLWGNNYESPLSKVVKLQNKAAHIINDVPLMEPITPHYELCVY